MATPLEISFSTDENTVVQADVQLLKKIVESLVVKFNQEKFDELLFSGFASPKAMRQYCKDSSGTHFRISLEISSKVSRTSAHNASGVTSNEVLKTSRVAHAVRVNISQETSRANASIHDQNNSEDQFHHLSPL